ncbi:MAG: TetR/AcrR family transcriptional regulator [Spirochaetales bacterium]|nr:TetR/AcrR family transcriptional regulator [Spirochaetales bacterium]
MNTAILGYDDSRTNARKRQQILTAAKSLFSEGCVDQTTMFLIAERSGVTRRTVYNYYESKEQIAVDVQILAIEEMNLDQLWTETLKDMRFECLQAFARALLVDHVQQMKSIACFDFFFHEGYPDQRYIDYVAQKSSLRLETLGITGSQSIEDHPLYGPRHFVLHLLTAYLLRLLQKTENTPDYAHYEQELNVFIRLLLTYCPAPDQGSFSN